MASYPRRFLILGLVRIPPSRYVVWNAYRYSGLFICVGQAILIATATFYLALVYPFIAAVFYFIQKYYLRTSRQLRFMDLEAKSPL
jgi:hypothetical protein